MVSLATLWRGHLGSSRSVETAARCSASFLIHVYSNSSSNALHQGEFLCCLWLDRTAPSRLLCDTNCCGTLVSVYSRTIVSSSKSVRSPPPSVIFPTRICSRCYRIALMLVCNWIPYLSYFTVFCFHLRDAPSWDSFCFVFFPPLLRDSFLWCGRNSSSSADDGAEVPLLCLRATVLGDRRMCTSIDANKQNNWCMLCVNLWNVTAWVIQYFTSVS